MASESPPPYDAIAFDCDSTLSTIEGVDELARPASPSVLSEIEALTDAAMGGEVALESVYGKRLELLQPTREQVAAIGQQYIETAVPNAKALVRALLALGKGVHIVSGGLAPAVEIFAAHLGLESDAVTAVGMHFDALGNYAGFDERSPCARVGGKIDVLRELAKRHGRVAHVGDGSTDAEVRPVVARFVGFGGVALRPAVRANAAVFVEENDFAALGRVLLSTPELERLAGDPRHAPLATAIQG